MAVTLMAVAGMVMAGEDTTDKTAVEKVMLCGKCGQIKGTDVCCKADAQKCSKCGLAKGAPGCCKLPKTK